MSPILLAVIIVVVIGAVLGIGLSIASVALSVPVDEKLEKVSEILPGANCGGCGFSGCDAYAAAMAEGNAEPNLCSVGGAETAKALAEALGVEAGEYIARVAYVTCNGGCDKTNQKYEYRGIDSCAAINALVGGDKMCNYGCLGRGDCVKSCKENAIHINKNGVAEVIPEICVGCGNCATVCPKGIITLFNHQPKRVIVKCKNKDKGAIARKECSAACIGCGICVKQCEFGAIEVKNNLARIDQTKCTQCGKCAEKCPQKCITIE